jgi:hypothetical protein
MLNMLGGLWAAFLFAQKESAAPAAKNLPEKVK